MTTENAARDFRELEITRRALLKLLGGGILVAALSPVSFALDMAQRGGQVPQQVSAWIHVGTDGKITVLTGKVEVGQNARTSLTQAAAEELRAPVESVKVTMGDTDLVPFDMGTFGSMTTPRMVPQIRKAAAAARETLIDLAAEKWKVDRKTLRAENGRIIGTDSTHSATYGELSQGQAMDKLIAADIMLTPRENWKIMGTPVPKVDGHEFVTGAHQYASDISRPGMLHARVLRPPSNGATLASVDTSGPQAMTGVTVVKDGDFVAVAAPTARLAGRGLFALKAEWREQSTHPGSKDLVALLRGGSARSTTQPMADKHLSATYSASFIAHVPLEPRVAVAEWDGKKMTVYTGTQRPFGVRTEVAHALDLPESQVRVIAPDTGSGYGGKHTGDAAVEAARISKMTGKAIKVAWTRVEEFTFAYFRPGGVVDVSSGAKADGSLAYWQFDNYNSGGAGIETPYEVSNPHSQYHEADSPLRQGSYRSLAAAFNHFARESHMDELSHEVGLDPLAFRLKNISNERLRAVLQTAAEHFGWGKQKPIDGHGFGLACGTDKGSYVATCAEVSVDPTTKAIRVIREVTAFDCGAILNPDHLKNQVEGAIIMGIGGALFEAIEFERGKILTDRLSRYRVPRYADVPKMETILLDHKDLPSAGAGETPIITIAPAIGNAIFAATGVRLRSMPLKFA